MDYISISRIKTYLNCPRKYKLRYIDRLPKPFKPVGLALGSAIHTAAEWFNRKLCDGEKPDFHELLKIFRTDWFNLTLDNIKLDNKESKDDILAKGEKLLNLFYERQMRDVKIEEVEVPFQVALIDRDAGEILPVPLRGIFDWIESDDTLVEMKTSGRIFDTDSSDNRLQLTAYDYAYRELFNRRPKIKILNLIKTKEPKLVEKEIILDEQDTRNLIGTAKLFLAGVQNKLFYPNKSFMCKNCEYAHICGGD